MIAAAAEIEVRRYGASGPLVVLLHGGPGALGYLERVARGLAGSFRVLEPVQRRSGGEPLTVAAHVGDLQLLIESCGEEQPPALVGHSWGAMLALAYAAAHPAGAGPVVLVSCGTFDPAARERLRATCEERMDDALRRCLATLPAECPDPDERLRRTHELLLPVYSHDLLGEKQEMGRCDARAHHESWDDMVRLQEAGVYPAAFRAIRGPVLMLHGTADPHPGGMIRASLEPHLPQLEYHEWERCGHYPWLERAVRDDFFAFLRDWLGRRCSGTGR